MIRFLRVAVLLSVSAYCVGLWTERPLQGAQHRQSLSSVHENGNKVSNSISQIVGVSISPLWGVVGIGMYGYFTSSSDTDLPFTSRPIFWAPLLVLLIVVLCKTAIGQAWPPAKPFLEAADVALVRKSAYILAALPFVIERIQHGVAGSVGQDLSFLIPFGTVHAAASASSPQGGPAQAAVLTTFGGALLLIGSVSVWLLSHTVDIVALLPIPLVDVALRTFRLAVLAVLAVLPPGPRFAFAIAIIAIAISLSRWAWRLTRMGTTFALDLLFLRWKRTTSINRSALAFSGTGLRGVPNRTRGMTVRTVGGIEFSYRDWLFRRRSRPIDPAQITLGIGFVYHCLLLPNAEGEVVAVRFPPRYRAQSSSIQSAFQIMQSRELGARRFWSSLKAWRSRRTGATARPAAAP